VDQAYGGDMGKIKQKITVCERNQKIYGGAVVRPIAGSILFFTFIYQKMTYFLISRFFFFFGNSAFMES